MDEEVASYWGAKLRGAGVTTEAVSGRVVTVAAPQPMSAMMTLLGHMNAAIVPGKEVEDGTLDLALADGWIGAGPFKVEGHQEDSRWTLSRFDDYWESDLLGLDVPKVEELIWQIIPDDSTRVAALRTGEIQMTFFENPKMLDVLSNEANILSTNQLTTNYYHLYLYANNPPLSDVRVRQALSLAIDRDQIVDLAAFGMASASGPMPAGFVGNTVPLSDLPYYGPNIAGAKALLEEAGYSDGFSIGMWVTDYIPATVSIAQVLKEQWKPLGVELAVEQRDQASWIAESFGADKVADAVVSWWAGYT
jgi:peptide/nickel transport system substrate-binding protein